MYLLLQLALLASFVCYSTAAQVDQVTPVVGSMKKLGDQTFYEVIDMTRTDLQDWTVNYKRLMVAANAGFNYIKTQPGITSGQGSQIALVACVGIEGQVKMYCASTPRDTMNQFFKQLLSLPQEPQSTTPRWETAFRVPGHGDWAHAEDLAYYMLEETEKFGPLPILTYPPGTTIAVWSSASQGDRGNGHAYYPCQDQGKVPTCQQVATSLGVIHAVTDPWKNLVNPQGAAPPDPLVDPQGAPPPTRRGLSTRDLNVTNFKRDDEPSTPRIETTTPETEAPMLDLTAVPISDDLVQAMLNFEQHSPAYSDMSPAMSPEPEDQFDTEELDAGDAGDAGDAAKTDTNTDTNTASNTGTITDSPSTPTATPSCILQNVDPDQGINTRYCICDSSKTYPIMSLGPTAANTDLCAYTALPDATATISTGFQPVTYTDTCQVCTQIVEFSDAECTPLPGCLPETAEASITAATQGMHVGTLTGDALYTSVSSALESICPDVSQTTSATECSGTAVIKDITYIEDDSIGHDGELRISVPFGSYNVTSLKHAMIKSLAANARSSASGNNCYHASYDAEGLKKRSIWPPSFSLFARDSLLARDHSTPHRETIKVCNTAELALINYYGPYWRRAPEPGATDFIEVKYDFHITGGSFACEFLELLADELAVIQPEFAVADVELGEVISTVCKALED